MRTNILAIVMIALVSIAWADSSLENTLSAAPKLEQLPELPEKRTKLPILTTIRMPSRTEVVSLWNNEYMSSVDVPMGWTGSENTCEVGDVSAEYRDATLRRINFYRRLAGVPANLRFDQGLNRISQGTALMMIANRRLDHFPSSSWKCYNAASAEAASRSIIAIGTEGAEAIDLYMEDEGSHNESVAHRRWLLFGPQRTLASGSTDARNGTYTGSNAIQVIGNFGPRPEGSAEVPWPPAGYIPYQLVPRRWSFTYPTADFTNSRVTMEVEGVGYPSIRHLPVHVGYADNTLVWEPSFWMNGSGAPAEDQRVKVRVENIIFRGEAFNFEYTVTIIDPAKFTGVKKDEAVEMLLSLTSVREMDTNHDGIVDAADVFLGH